MDKYIAGTSDMFRQFIDRGLTRLEAAGGAAALPPPVTPPGAGLAAAAASPAAAGPSPGSARPDGPQSRLGVLRDRMVRASVEGGMGGGGSSLPPTPGSAGPQRVRPGAEAGAAPAAPPPRGSSIDELNARMQALRRPTR